MSEREQSSPENLSGTESYYGIQYKGWAIHPDFNGFSVQQSGIVDRQAKNYPIGDVNIRWEPEFWYTSDSPLLYGLAGASLGVRIALAEELAKASPVSRRSFLRAVFSGGLGALIGVETLPPNVEMIAQNHRLGKKDPARVIQGLVHPRHSIEHFTDEVVQIEKPVVGPIEQIFHQGKNYAITAREVNYRDEEQTRKDMLYLFRPQKPATIQLHTTAQFPSPQNSITIGADILQFAHVLKPSEWFSLFGIQEGVLPSHFGKTSHKKTHTVPTALSAWIDDVPFAVTSANWTHPFAISYADFVRINRDDLQSWIGFAAKTGVWSPDFLERWDEAKSATEFNLNKDLLRQKFTEDGWTEAPSDHPAFHRLLHIADNKITIGDDKHVWNDFVKSVDENPKILADSALLRPGMIIDLQSDKPIPSRRGGLTNGISVNGLLFGNQTELLGLATLNQDRRMTSETLVEIISRAEPNARYYVGTDEHGGGGIVHLK